MEISKLMRASLCVTLSVVIQIITSSILKELRLLAQRRINFLIANLWCGMNSTPWNCEALDVISKQFVMSSVLSHQGSGT